MAQPLTFVGTVQFWPNGARGNPVALYMDQSEHGAYRITVRLPDWTHVVGTGATVNKAAGNYELNLKAAASATGASYEGPYWNDGIKAEKPAPPKPAAVAPSSVGEGPADAPPAAIQAGGGPADAPPAPTALPSLAS